MSLQLFNNSWYLISSDTILGQMSFYTKAFKEFSRFPNCQVCLFLVAAAGYMPDTFCILQKFRLFLCASYLQQCRQYDRQSLSMINAEQGGKLMPDHMSRPILGNPCPHYPI